MAINHSESIDRLFESILNLKSIDECYNYFEDLCTVKEIIDMSAEMKVFSSMLKADGFNENELEVKEDNNG